jgi:hypothetical protein
MDVITGIWNEKKRYASWSTDDGNAQGFALIGKNGKGKLYIDKNGNNKFDKKDRKIGKVVVTDAANDYTSRSGTWTADLDARTGSFFDSEGIEVAIARYSNTSFF